MADRIGTAVLELTTGGGLLREFEQIKAGSRGVDSEFERLRRRAQDLGGDLKRAVERFQGRALIDEAKRVSQAVAEVGGAAKLTDRELKQVRDTVTAATDKMRRMGEDVPPSMRKLNAEITALDAASAKASKGGISSMLGGLGSLRTLLPALSATAAVAGLVRIGTAAFESAGHLIDLSQKTGLSTDALQEMQAVAAQTGTSVDAFTSNTFKLGVNVSTATTKVKDAAKDLKLSWEELSKASPEQQFRMVITALEGVTSTQERNRLGTAIFGKEFKEIAASVEEGYSKIAGAASKSSREQLEALDRAGDAWAKFKDDVSKAVTTTLGNIVLGMQDLERAADSMTFFEKVKLFAKGGGNFASYGAELKKLGNDLRQAEDQQKKNTQATQENIPVTTNYITKLRELQAELRTLDAADKAQIAAAMKLDGVTDELSTTVGVSVEALRLYTSQSKESAKATKELSAEEAKRKAILDSFVMADYFDKLFGTSVRAQIAATNQELHNEVDSLERMETTYIGIVPAVASWQAALVPLKGTITEVNGEIVQQVHDIEQLRQKWEGIGRQISQILVQSFTGGGGVEGAFKALGALGGQEIGKELGKSLSKAIGGKLGAVVGGMAGPLGAALGSLAGSLAGKFFGKLFGGEHKEVNNLRDKFTDAAGGIHALNVKAQAAGLTLDRFLKAKTVKEYEAAVKELEDAFKDLEEQTRRNTETANDLFTDIMELGRNGIPASMQPAIDKLIEMGLLTEDQIAQLRALGTGGGASLEQLEDAASTLGAELETLGPAFAQQKLDQEAAKVHAAITRLIDAGGDWGSTMMASKEELASLVSSAKKGHLTLSESLRPFIQDLMATGNLVDENGEKITDLAGINWGPEMKTEAQIAEEGWNKILAAIERLIDTIAGPLDTALDDVTRDRTINITPKLGTITIPDYDAEYGGGERNFATGIFRGRFSNTGTPAMLHGVESVVPRAAELDFAQRVLAERGTEITNNSSQAAIVGVIMGDGKSRTDIGREAARFLADKGLAMNTANVGTALTQFLDAYFMNLGGRLAGAR